MFSFRKVDSTPIHVTCKFAMRYGKDCESEVQVNLDFRMPARNGGRINKLVNI